MYSFYWRRRLSAGRLLMLSMVAAAALDPLAALAQNSPNVPLDRQGIVAIARQQAPAVLRAELRVRRQEAERVGAGQFSTQNPSFQMQAGPRFSAEGVEPDLAMSGWLPVPAFLDRARNVEAAEAGISASQSDAELVRLHATAQALDLYVRVLHAKERLGLAHDRATLALTLLETATKREQAGDASQLDVVLAQADAAASEANVFSAKAELQRRVQNLALALGFKALEVEDIQGKLSEQRTLPSSLSSSAQDLIALALKSHPSLAAADADLKHAKAQRHSAALGWLPKVAVGAGYAFGESAHIPTLGFRSTLPIFDFGQAQQAREGVAVDVATREKALRQLEVQAGVLQAVRIYSDSLAAAEILEEKALGNAAKASQLVGVSYAAGKSDLGAVLVVRRNTLLIRAEYLARQLDAALAANRVGLVVGALGD